jgi:ATP-dependent Clp protease protease subunit
MRQVMGGMEGQASDIKIRAERMLRMKERLNKILADTTGKDIKAVEKDTDRDNFMLPTEALKYGLIDKVID